MKNKIVLSNGVKIKVSKNGVDVIATDGEVLRFDDGGKLLGKGSFTQEEAFDFMGRKERDIAKKWVRKTKGDTNGQAEFIKIVKKAAAKVKKDYYIANIEASIANTGKLYYKKGSVVARGLSVDEWKQKAREFAPECGSKLASKYQLVLWYAYRIAMGFWTIEYVCDDSSSAGNYWTSPNAIHKFEVSGAREVGGARDGVGNTYKIVIDGEAVLFGGCCGDYGEMCPVASFGRIDNPFDAFNHGAGVVVLKKCSTEC